MNDLLTALRADGVGAVALLLKAIEIKSASECHFGSVHGHDGVCVLFLREREREFPVPVCLLSTDKN